MGSPKVSVLIPCYNLGRYLDETVDSALAQTLGDFEVIIVDDGSTDPFTIELLADYRRPKTRVFATENRGAGSARNLAIENAAGEYLCALDADDLLDPSYLERTAGALDAYPSLDFISSWVRMFGDEDRVWKQERCDLPALLAECTVCTAALVRKSAVLAVGGYCCHRECSEDWDLWISLVEHGFRGMILPEALFRYRRRHGSKSALWEQADANTRRLVHLVERHKASYQEHLLEVLLWKHSEIGNLLRTRPALVGHLEASLVTGARSPGDLVECLVRRQAGVEPEREAEVQLREALLKTQEELSAVLESKSWTLTAPLRAAARWSRRVAGRLGYTGAGRARARPRS